MKKSFMIATMMLLASSITYGAEVKIHAGWNLLGTQVEIDDMSIFNISGVNVIWAWDNNNKNWKIYTSDENLMQLAQLYGIESLSYIEPFSGFWIKASEDTTVSLPEAENVIPTSLCYKWIPKDYLDILPEDIPSNYMWLPGNNLWDALESTSYYNSTYNVSYNPDKKAFEVASSSNPFLVVDYKALAKEEGKGIILMPFIDNQTVIDYTDYNSPYYQLGTILIVPENVEFESYPDIAAEFANSTIYLYDTCCEGSYYSQTPYGFEDGKIILYYYNGYSYINEDLIPVNYREKDYIEPIYKIGNIYIGKELYNYSYQTDKVAVLSEDNGTVANIVDIPSDIDTSQKFVNWIVSSANPVYIPGFDWLKFNVSDNDTYSNGTVVRYYNIDSLLNNQGGDIYYYKLEGNSIIFSYNPDFSYEVIRINVGNSTLSWESNGTSESAVLFSNSDFMKQIETTCYSTYYRSSPKITIIKRDFLKR